MDIVASASRSTACGKRVGPHAAWRCLIGGSRLTHTRLWVSGPDDLFEGDGMTDQPSHLPSELRTLVKRYGTRVLDDADGLRATLDDFLDEGAASPGDVNLLIDAVRFGSLPRLETLLGEGAEPSAATADVAAALAQRRGGDAESAYWACAVLGYAAELLPGDLIPGTWVRSSSQFPPSATATGATSASVADHGADFDPHTFGRTGATPFDDPDVTHRPASGFGGDPDQPPPTGSVGPGDNSSTAGTRRGRRTWVIAAIATIIVLLAAAVIYLAVTRTTSGSDTAGGSEVVPMSLVTPHNKFGHFGDAIENGTALGTCYNSPTQGSVRSRTTAHSRTRSIRTTTFSCPT